MHTSEPKVIARKTKTFQVQDFTYHRIFLDPQLVHHTSHRLRSKRSRPDGWLSSRQLLEYGDNSIGTRMLAVGGELTKH